MDEDGIHLATAGPSSIPLFLAPNPSSQSSVGLLKSTDDLLTRLGLLEAYQKHLQGKGKARATDNNDLEDDNNSEEDASGAVITVDGIRTEEKGYRSLIRPCPGKHSMKRDPQPYLTTLALAPPRDTKPYIRSFDEQTLEGFRVSDEGIKGWSIKALVEESKAAKEERRKRKELKRQRLAQTPLPSLNINNNLARTKSSTPTTPSFGVGTPGGSGQRGTKRPRDSTSSPHQRNLPPGLRTPLPTAQQNGNPSKPGTPIVMPTTPAARSSVSTPNGTLPTPSSEPQSSYAMGAVYSANKIGISGHKPRPVKKQRMDPLFPTQQPTPTSTTM